MPKALFIIPLVLLLACVSLLFSYSGAAAVQETQIEVHSVSVQMPGIAKTPKEPLYEAASTQLPSFGEEGAIVPSAQNVQGAGLPARGSVRINTATQAELEMLPGIGPAKARAILDYIKGNGPFETVEELMQVKGIGEATLEKMRPYLAEIN